MPKRIRKLQRRRRRQAPPSGRKAGLRLGESILTRARQELIAFHQLFASHFVRAEQRCWSAFYLCGQLSGLPRKTIEPTRTCGGAGVVLALLGIAPEVIRAVQQFIGQSPWAREPFIAQLDTWVADWLGEADGVVIVDGSGFPKRGDHSAGVAWQYCGRLGKVENCQEGVFVVYVSSQGQAFLNGRLYLPEKWFASDHALAWERCGIPDQIMFRTEPEIALDLIRQVAAQGQVPFRWVTADEEFGRNPSFLEGLADLGKWYLAEVPKNTRVWLRTPGIQSPGPSLIGRPRLHPRVRPSAPLPQSVADLAARWPASGWKRRCIREGGQGPMWAEFTWLRVTVVRDQLPGPRHWLVIRRSLDRARKLKFYLSNAPANCSPAELVRLTGYRWPIETAFEEAKGEVGMDHYETRSWMGWHHHMTQTFMAHLFLVRLQQLIQKKSSDNHQSGSPTHRTGDCRRIRRQQRHSELHSLLAETKSAGVSLTSKAYTASVAL